MVEQDTIRLLRECDAGVKMGISSIDDVMKYVKSERLRKDLADNREEHCDIDKDLQELLDEYRSMNDEGKAAALAAVRGLAASGLYQIG